MQILSVRRVAISLYSAATALLLSAFPVNSFAWGPVGHAAVADIAQAHLTPAAAAQIRTLLAVEGAHNLSDISLWADQAKADHLPGSPSHTIRLPLDGSSTPPHPCPGHFCADDAITRYGAVLSDKSQPLADREVALKYIVHLVGDLHQPLHDVDQTGQMTVIFHGRSESLHAVWDDEIIDSYKINHQQLALNLLAKEANVPHGGTPADWAAEGRLICQQEIFPAIPPHAKDPITLPEDYAQLHWPTVELRLTEGGLRLAEVLNQLLK